MATLYENQGTSTTLITHAANDQEVSQSFTVGATGHTVSSVKLNLAKTGSGTFTVDARIFAADGSHHPTGSVICSGSMSSSGISTNPTHNTYEFTMNVESTLSANTEYCIVLAYDAAPVGTDTIVPYGVVSTLAGQQLSTSNAVPPTSWIDDNTERIFFQVFGNPLGGTANPHMLSSTGVGA